MAVAAIAEELFDRQWAWMVLDRVLSRLESEQRTAGTTLQFECLRGCLPGAGSGIDYAKAAAALQMNEPAVRMAAHRMRRRYGELLRAEIATTVGSPEEINEEIRYLRAVIGKA